MLEPRYKIPNKTTFSKNKVVKLYDATREAVSRDLNSVDFFASTTDMWSSHGLTPYMGHTLHWIDSEWNLRFRNLGTKFVPEDHTAEQLGKTMNDMLEHWKLNAEKQIAITTNNGANIKKACKDIEWTNVPCFWSKPPARNHQHVKKYPEDWSCIGDLQKDRASFRDKLEETKRSCRRSSPGATG